ncbi:MAG: hypothetical protein ACYTFA_09365 [Planctomycetota bacterium]
MEGLVLTRTRGDVETTFKVLSVNASGNRLVIGYQSALEIEQMIIEGTGSWAYQYVPPDTLDFHDTFDGRTNVSDFGEIDVSCWRRCTYFGRMLAEGPAMGSLG